MEADQHAEYVAARRRLVKASDAWIEHEEAFLPIKEEYYAAFAALEAVDGSGGADGLGETSIRSTLQGAPGAALIDGQDAPVSDAGTMGS